MNRFFILLLTLCLPLFACVSPKGSGNEGTARLEFHSFSGGGPEFNVEIQDPDVVSVEKTYRYDKRDAYVDGAGFDVYFTFTGLKAGTTLVTVAERSPIAGNFDHLYEVAVDKDLKVQLTKLSVADLDALTEPTATLAIETEGRIFYAAFADNASAAAFRDRLNDGPLVLTLQDYGHFEKVGDLPWALEQSDEEITAVPGDVILYQGDKLSIYYDENTWTFTRLGRIENVTREELLAAFGEGDVTVTLYLEWSE